MGYIVKKADLENDKTKILNFWNANHDRPLDQKYNWMYQSNPSGEAQVWLLRHQESGDLVGMAALFPRWVSLQGEKKLSVIAGDFYVHEKHRTIGPALMLQKRVVAEVGNDVAVFAYCFPNRPAEPIMKRIGYRTVGHLRRWVKITRTAPQLISRGVPRAVAFIISPLLDACIHLGSKVFWYKGSKQYICEKTDCIDERFDRLWESKFSTYQFIGIRDKEYLGWKYLQDPDDDHRYFTITDIKNNTLKGYIIFCQRKKRIEIRDAFFPTSRDAMENLIGAFLKYTAKLSSDAIELSVFTSNSQLHATLQRFGFRDRGKTRSVCLYFPDENDRKKFIGLLSNSCFFMRGDEDT